MTIINLKNNLIKICENKNISTSNILIAIDSAESAHNNQYRKSGEPYITHPIEVAILVADLDGSEAMIKSSFTS